MAKNSIGWELAFDLFANSDISVRELARRLGVSEKTVRNRIKTDGWLRVADEIPQEVRTAEGMRTSQLKGAGIEQSVDELRHVARILIAEIRTTCESLQLLRDLVEIETAEDEGSGRRRAIEKVLSLPGLTQALKNIATALSALRDAEPGKKEQRQRDAENASVGTEWGDDLNPQVMN